MIAGGAYYLSLWIATPIAFVYGKVTSWVVYRGGLEAAVEMPLVTGLPYALVAAVVGATIVLLVESKRPVLWVIFPAALYAYSAFFGFHWMRVPTFTDRVGQVVAALFLVTCCIAGGVVAQRRRAASLQT